MARPTFPELDRAVATPLSTQIAAHYAAGIAEGRLAAGERLPTIRAVAEHCGVTRTTVQEAFRQLAAAGYVEATVGRGTTVLMRPSQRASGLRPHSHPLSPFAEAALRRTREMQGGQAVVDGVRLVANFAELTPDTGRFPVAEWRAAMDAVLQSRGADLLGYGAAANGMPALRELFAARARQFDPKAEAADVLVTGGAQQALDLALRTFCAPGDAVVVTDPCYHNMFGLLRAHGLEAVPVPFGSDGLDLDRLRRALARPDVRLVYLMPTFHNPTGRTLDLARRRELAAVLQATAIPLVEDEFQHSLRFRGEALPSMRSLDARGLTVTVATASKELFPALRIGWVLGSAEVLAPMAAVKRFMDLETSALLQAALVEFVARGGFDHYLDELRDELRKRHAALQAAAAAYLPAGCTVTDPDGGFVVWLEMPTAPLAARLAELAAERGVRVVPGRMFDPNSRPSRGLRLSLTRADAAAIDRGLAVLGEAARQILEEPVSARTFL
ncbi:MAG: PLP-dependent aminotransferase family protein [Planctomycetota bacterium]